MVCIGKAPLAPSSQDALCEFTTRQHQILRRVAAWSKTHELNSMKILVPLDLDATWNQFAASIP
jgi:hypothetical protein